MSTVDTASRLNDIWNGESITVITAITISLYNCFELLLLIFTTFKEWRNLYFASLVVASIGVIPYCTGFALEYFGKLVFWAAMMFSTIGWVMLITGQSLVLYSRLGLIITNEKILKAVKWMIIVDGLVFHIATTAIQYGKSYGSEQADFSKALFYMEKIQMTGFCIQEFIISGLYLWKSFQLLRVIEKEGTKRVMWELVTINTVIILMDIALLALEYTGLRTMERAFKVFIYSVKLKLEFAILGKLVDLVQSSSRTLSNALQDVDSFVDHTRSRTNSSAHPDYIPGWVAKLEKQKTEHIEHAQTSPSLGKK